MISNQVGPTEIMRHYDLNLQIRKEKNIKFKYKYNPDDGIFISSKALIRAAASPLESCVGSVEEERALDYITS